MNKKKIEKFIKVSAGVLGAAFVVTSVVGKKKSAESKFENEPDQKNSLEGKKVIFVENEDDFIAFLLENGVTHKEANDFLEIPLRKIQAVSKALERKES